MQAVEVRRRLLGGGPGSGRYPKGSGGEQAAPAQHDAGAVSPEHLQKITQALKMHDYLHTGNYYDNDVAALHAIGLDSSKLDAMREVYGKWVVTAPSNVRRSMELAVTDPKAAPEEYRGEYEVTQAKLRMLYPGQKTITLYRGLNPSDETYTGDRAAWADSFQKMREADEAGKPIDIKSFGGADSWTDSPDTAQRFATGDGYVLSQKVPLSRVFGSYKTSDALGENEHEFVVVPQNHIYARTSVMHAAGEVVTISLDDFDPNWLHKQPKIEAGGPGSGRYPKGSTGNGDDPQETIHQYRHLDGSWEPQREALHERIINDVFAGKHPHPEGPEATLMGGGSGSGKTTLGNKMITASPDAVRIDADAVRAQIPEYKQFVAEGRTDAAALTHEEASYLTKRMLAKALANKYDLIYDSTSSGKTGPAFLDRLQAAGYQTHLLFADTSVNEATRRAELRANNPLSSEFGRHVPRDVIQSSHASSAANFMKMKDHPGVTSVHLYDNTGSTPQLIYGRSGNRNPLIGDQPRWESYQRKAGHTA